MNKRKRLATALALGGALLAGCSTGQLGKPPAQDGITILRDHWGVPHVYAATTRDLFTGYGYVIAEDRLYQMEMARRSVTGTVAEVLGEAHVQFDIATRALFDPESIRRQIDALGDDDRAILEGYAAGFNRRIDEVLADKARLMPKQFLDAGFEPSRWTTFDVAMIYIGTMVNRYSGTTAELANVKALNALVKAHGEKKVAPSSTRSTGSRICAHRPPPRVPPASQWMSSTARTVPPRTSPGFSRYRPT